MYILYILYIYRQKWDKVQSGTMGKPRVYATVGLKYLEIIYAILCYTCWLVFSSSFLFCI